MQTTHILAVANQKGGVSKTTTAINLAYSLQFLGKRALLIDLDPQGNATTGCGIDKTAVTYTIADVLCGKISAQQAVVTSDIDMAVIPANSDLTATEIFILEHGPGREKLLVEAIQPIIGNYDYIFIDCLPSLNVLTVNALTAANGVVIPMQCEYFALEGITDLVNTINGIKQRVNPHLRIEAIVRTMFDSRNSLTNDVSLQLVKFFGEKVMQTLIPRNVRLAEAPSHGMPALQYDRTSKGALAYLALAEELLRIHQHEKEERVEPRT